MADITHAETVKLINEDYRSIQELAALLEARINAFEPLWNDLKTNVGSDAGDVVIDGRTISGERPDGSRELTGGGVKGVRQGVTGLLAIRDEIATREVARTHAMVRRIRPNLKGVD